MKTRSAESPCVAITRTGLSLIEVTAAILVLGIAAALILSTARRCVSTADTAACHSNIGDIELQAELWLQHTGSWPANDLSDIDGDLDYFPSGLPVCPVDGTSYQLDGAGSVVGHTH
ncbi:MAG: hypothetical protein CMJ58_09560 [Planctomycetaceae bacterium]|nr:hypothetical protein [Planctomycetaceae bacterium]